MSQFMNSIKKRWWFRQAAVVLAVLIASGQIAAQEAGGGLTKIELLDGTVVEGAIVEETFDEVVIRTVSGETQHIPSDKIKEITYPEKAELVVEEGTEADAEEALQRMRSVAATPKPGGAFVKVGGAGHRDLLVRGMVSILDGQVTIQNEERTATYPLEEVTEVIGEHYACISTSMETMLEHRRPDLTALIDKRVQEIFDEAGAKHDQKVAAQLEELCGGDPPGFELKHDDPNWQIWMDRGVRKELSAPDIAKFLNRATREIANRFDILQRPKEQVRVRVFSSSEELADWKRRFEKVDTTFEMNVNGNEVMLAVLRDWYQGESSVLTLDCADLSDQVKQGVVSITKKMDELLVASVGEMDQPHFTDLVELYLYFMSQVSLATAMRNGEMIAFLAGDCATFDFEFLISELRAEGERAKAQREKIGKLTGSSGKQAEADAKEEGAKQMLEDLGRRGEHSADHYPAPSSKPLFEIQNPGYFCRSTRELVVLADEHVFVHLAHEAFHSVTAEHGMELPGWLEEGLATYFEALSVKAEGVDPTAGWSRIDERTAILKTGEPEIKLSALLDATREEFQSAEQRSVLLYDDSWLLVHYLLEEYVDGGLHRGKKILNRVMELCQDGRDWQEVKSTIFTDKLAISRIEEALKKYASEMIDKR